MKNYYFVVDGNGNEFIYHGIMPYHSSTYGHWTFTPYFMPEFAGYNDLVQGSIKAIAGRKKTWNSKPFVVTLESNEFSEEQQAVLTGKGCNIKIVDEALFKLPNKELTITKDLKQSVFDELVMCIDNNTLRK